MRRDRVFAGTAVATLVLLFLSSPLALLWLGWFLDEGSDQISHRVHEITFGALFAVVFVGVVAQLRHPERNLAGMLQAILAVGVLAAVEVSASGSADPLLLLYVVPVVTLAVLHPARRRLFWPPLAPGGWQLGLGLAAVPALLVMATDELDRASQQVGGHVEHWGAMAAFAFTVIGLILIAGLRPPGWRVSAWSAGVATAIYAGTSVAYPDDASSAVLRTPPWVFMALVWSGLFVVVAERTRPERERPAAKAPAVTTPRPLARRGLRVLAVAAGVFGLLLMAAVWGFEDAPRIPHQVASTSRAHCASCHGTGVNPATGEANVPAIDLAAHPDESAPGRCVDCHDEGGFLEVEGAMAVQAAGAEAAPTRAVAFVVRPAEVRALSVYERSREPA
jgi:hypothetical protein